MEKILLFDGNSIINRAFYATPVLTNSDGLYTNAVFGFMNMFYRFVDEEKPERVGVCFDLPAPTFRHEKFTQYKAGRRKMPDELSPQIPLLKELLGSLNVPCYELSGYEADDLLGTLAKAAEQHGDEAVIVSGDRDMLQIASENIKIRIPKTKGGKTEVADFTADGVFAEYGVTPAQFIDVKALMGDASDNIPGVSGIGEKTALKIIAEYKTLDNAIEQAGGIKPAKAGASLLAEKDTALLSRELATITITAPVTLSESLYDGELTEGGLKLLERLGFKSLLARLAKKGAHDAAGTVRHFEVVDDVNAFAKGLSEKPLAAYMVFSHENEINGFSFAFEEGGGYFVEIETPFHENAVLAALKPFFESDGVKKVTTDAKASFKILGSRGVTVRNAVFDVSLAGYVLDPTMSAYTVDVLADKYLGETRQSEEDALGKGKSKVCVLALDKEKRAQYCGGAANAIFRLYPVMDEKIKENGQEDLYCKIENPLMYVLFDMERQGIRVDRGALTRFGAQLEGRIDELTQSIYAHAGSSFNINSPKQLGEVLFEGLKLKSLKKTKTGYSTNIEELERLRDEHPVIPEIIEYRSYTKLKSTYVDGLLAVMDTETGKLHTTFNQTVAATGRLSSTEPNLQNIPVRLALGRELRRAFIPDSPEYVFIDADYSQIELRVLAHISEDKSLISAFESGLDIHRLTASQVNDMPYELITPGQRNAAKAVNFGIIYGISAFSLSVDLGISKYDADKYINAYFAAYPNIKKYLDGSVDAAKRKGYAETIFGRRRPMPELNSPNFNTRSFGERVAKNMPIQGAAADIIKIAMINVYNAFVDKGLKSKMLLQVHDELLVLTHRDETEEVTALLKKEMSGAAKLLVPLEIDVHTGETWYDAK